MATELAAGARAAMQELKSAYDPLWERCRLWQGWVIVQQAGGSGGGGCCGLGGGGGSRCYAVVDDENSMGPQLLLLSGPKPAGLSLGIPPILLKDILQVNVTHIQINSVYERLLISPSTGGKTRGEGADGVSVSKSQAEDAVNQLHAHLLGMVGETDRSDGIANFRAALSLKDAAVQVRLPAGKSFGCAVQSTRLGKGNGRGKAQPTWAVLEGEAITTYASKAAHQPEITWPTSKITAALVAGCLMKQADGDLLGFRSCDATITGLDGLLAAVAAGREKSRSAPFWICHGARGVAEREGGEQVLNEHQAYWREQYETDTVAMRYERYQAEGVGRAKGAAEARP